MTVLAEARETFHHLIADFGFQMVHVLAMNSALDKPSGKCHDDIKAQCCAGNTSCEINTRLSTGDDPFKR